MLQRTKRGLNKPIQKVDCQNNKKKKREEKSNTLNKQPDIFLNSSPKSFQNSASVAPILREGFSLEEDGGDE